jgi:hypothetical protein
MNANAILHLLRGWNSAAIHLIQQFPGDRLEEGERAAIRAGSILRHGASSHEISAAEDRLNLTLSGELRDLLAFSNGFLIPLLGPGVANFLTVQEIDFYSKREPHSYRDWVDIAGRFALEEDKPAEPPNEVEEIEIPDPRYLERSVALSTERGGEILLMHVSGRDSWSYLKLSAHTKIFKYSCLHMMLSQLMQDSLSALQLQLAELE